MSEQRTRRLMAFAVERRRLQIRMTLLMALIPLAVLRGALDAVIDHGVTRLVGMALRGLFWLAYVGVVYFATRRPS